MTSSRRSYKNVCAFWERQALPEAEAKGRGAQARQLGIQATLQGEQDSWALVPRASITPMTHGFIFFEGSVG